MSVGILLCRKKQRLRRARSLFHPIRFAEPRQKRGQSPFDVPFRQRRFHFSASSPAATAPLEPREILEFFALLAIFSIAFAFSCRAPPSFLSLGSPFSNHLSQDNIANPIGTTKTTAAAIKTMATQCQRRRCRIRLTINPTASAGGKQKRQSMRKCPASQGLKCHFNDMNATPATNTAREYRAPRKHLCLPVSRPATALSALPFTTAFPLSSFLFSMPFCAFFSAPPRLRVRFSDFLPASLSLFSLFFVLFVLFVAKISTRQKRGQSPFNAPFRQRRLHFSASSPAFTEIAHSHGPPLSRAGKGTVSVQ